MIYTSPNPYDIITTRAKKIVDDIEAQIQNGTITTQTQLLAKILDVAGRFNQFLTGPSMDIKTMRKDDLLIRELVSLPFEASVSDVELAFGQIEKLRELTLQIFNLCQAERAGLGEVVAEVTSLVDAYRLWVSDSDPSFIWAGDSFNDKSKVDPASTVFVEVHGGTATLQPTTAQSLSEKIVSAVLDRDISAGGLPGSNMEIRAPGQEAFTGTNPEPVPLLYGDTPPPVNSLAAIFDGQPDTWFEWERLYIDPTQAVIQVGQALVYDPAGKTPYQTKKKTILGIFHTSKRGGLQIPALPNWNCYIKWPGDVKVDTGNAHAGFPLAYFNDSDRITLRLGVNITLDQPRVVSWLQLTPLIRGTAYPQVDQILISSDGQHWNGLLDVPTVLNPRINRGVDFSDLGNSASNFEGVGVWPFPPVPIKNIKITFSQPNVYDAPLGLGHRFTMSGKKRKRAQGPIKVAGSSASTLQDSPDVDFSQDTVETAQDPNVAFDILAGRRQMIGIRDLLLETRNYSSTSQLISLPFTMDRPVKSVSLITAEKVPDEWPKTRPDGGPWIAYEVSSDGSTWSVIVPQSGQLENSVVQFDTPTTTVYLRANFSRPEETPSQSPILAAYSLKMLPA